MSSINEELSYLKGLFDGLEPDKNEKSTKLFNAIINVMDELCQSMNDLEERQDTLEELIDEIDEDLADVEDEFYGDDDDDDDDSFVEIECPHCGEDVFIDLRADGDEITCPSCGNMITCDETTCECGCNHQHDEE